MKDSDQFALLKVISGLKEQVRTTATYGNDQLKEMRNGFSGMLEQLIEVVNTLHSEEEELIVE